MTTHPGIWLLSLWLLLACSPSATAATENLRILVLHSYSQEYPWTKRQHAGFMSRLTADDRTDPLVETEYLDTKRHVYSPKYAAKFADYLAFKYSDFEPKLIYVSDDNALNFAITHLNWLFPKVPVFFSGVNDFSVQEHLSGRSVTGVFEHKEIARNLDLLSAMARDTGEIVVIGDGSGTYRAIERELRQELQSYSSTTARFVVNRRLEGILGGLQKYSADALFLTTLGEVHDDDGQVVMPKETIRRIAAVWPGVILSMEDIYLYDGVLGGFVTSGFRQGQTAAGLVEHFLAGGGMLPPVIDSPNEYLFDARELARHKLTLPREIRLKAKLLNQPPSFYQRYSRWIMGTLVTLALLLLLSLITFLLLLSRKNRVIQNRSLALAEQVKIAVQSKDSVNESQRLARLGSWELDLRTRAFTHSEGLRYLCGMPTGANDTILEDFLRYIPGQDREKFISAIAGPYDATELSSFYHQLLRPDGSVMVVTETVRLDIGQTGEPERLIGTVQDVTEQQRARAVLRENEEKYRRLFELSEDPMWLIGNSRFIMANPASGRELGYDSVEELLGLHPSQISPELQPDGRTSEENANENMALAYEKGYHRFEWLHKKRDGSVSPAWVSLTRVPFDGGDALFSIWRDTSELKAVQKALEEKTIYLDGMLSASEKVAVIATDAKGLVRYYNPTAEKLFGLTAADALGTSLDNVHSKLKLDKKIGPFGPGMAKPHGDCSFLINIPLSGSEHIIDVQASPILRDSSDFAGFMLMCEDITEQRRAAEFIEYQANYDSLTDLPNRRLFADRLRQSLALARRRGHRGAVLFFDLDNFKNINDSLGHPVGDKLLQLVARRIMNSVRDEDTVARLGGDEFVVLLPQLSIDTGESANDVQALAEKLRQQVSTPYRLDSHDLHLTASIGIALYPYDNESPDDILRQADTAMYRAKDSGRNAIRFFLPSMQQAADKRLQMLNEMRRALPGSEFQLFYQPQYDAGNHLRGAEALLRWQHPKRGLVMPDEFISLAEESGLVVEIGDWVMHQALTQLHNWQTQSLDACPDRVAINVSALQFHQTDFVHKVEKALGNTGTEPGDLTLEMTESILLQDFKEAIEKINALKHLGVRFALDDFGTGYSSLAYLKRLPVDELKIDRSFVAGVTEDAHDAALVETIMTLARRIGLEVVAEGVETEQTMTFLCQRGCPLFQGYYFGRPCAAPEFTESFLNTGKLPTPLPRPRPRPV